MPTGARREGVDARSNSWRAAQGASADREGWRGILSGISWRPITFDLGVFLLQEKKTFKTPKKSQRIV